MDLRLAIGREVCQDIEVIFDGGIRSGQDVMRAFALGARSCMLGRSYIHGLGAGGQPGVEAAIRIIEKELRTTMALCGVPDVKHVDTNVLRSGPWLLPPRSEV